MKLKKQNEKFDSQTLPPQEQPPPIDYAQMIRRYENRVHTLSKTRPDEAAILTNAYATALEENAIFARYGRDSDELYANIAKELALAEVELKVYRRRKAKI
jgi:hypothetical protein